MNKKMVNAPIKIIQILPGQEQPPKSPLRKPPTRSELAKKTLHASKRALAWLTAHTLRTAQAGRSLRDLTGRSFGQAALRDHQKHGAPEEPVEPRRGDSSDAALQAAPIEETRALTESENTPPSQPPPMEERIFMAAVRGRLSSLARFLRVCAGLVRQQLDAVWAAAAVQWPRRREELKIRQAAIQAALSRWGKKAMAFLAPRVMLLCEKSSAALRHARSRIRSMNGPGRKRDLFRELETAKSILRKQQQDLADLGAQLVTVKRDMEAQKQMVAAFAKRLEGSQRATASLSSAKNNQNDTDSDQPQQAIAASYQERNPVRRIQIVVEVEKIS